MTVENDGQVIVGSNATPIANTLTTINAGNSQIGLFVNSNNSARSIRALNSTGTQFVIDGGNLDPIAYQSSDTALFFLAWGMICRLKGASN